MNSKPAAASHSHSLRLLRKIDGSKVNILIVEDNDSSRRLVVELLRSSGFSNLTIARSAEDAIAQMQGQAPDLILLDWGLPGMSGIDEFVIKPFSTVSILKAICSCVLRRRPFIVSAGYVGPCRRRAKKKDGSYIGLLRRASDIEAAAEENAKRMYKESLSVELNGLRAYMQARGGLTPRMLEHMVARLGQAEESAHRFRLKLIEQATHSLHEYMDLFGDDADPEVLDVHLDALIQLNEAPAGDNIRANTMVRNLKALVAKRKTQRRAVA